MFENPSLITRIAIGKVIGFLFGLIGFIFLPYFLPEADCLLKNQGVRLLDHSAS